MDQATISQFQDILDAHDQMMAPRVDEPEEPATPNEWRALTAPTRRKDGEPGPPLLAPDGRDRIGQRAFSLLMKWQERAPDLDQDEIRQLLTLRILENARKDPAHLDQSYGLILQRATWQVQDQVLRKRERRRASIGITYDLDEPATADQNGPTMAETMVTDGLALFREWHTRADLLLALEELPARACQSLILSKIAGYRIKDLAPLLDVGPATVSRDLKNATRALRNDPRLTDYSAETTAQRLIPIASLCAQDGEWTALLVDRWLIYNGRRIRRVRTMREGEYYAAELYTAAPPEWRPEWTAQLDQPDLHHDLHDILINLPLDTLIENVPPRELWRETGAIGQDGAALYHERRIIPTAAQRTMIPTLTARDGMDCKRARMRNAPAGMRPTIQDTIRACETCNRAPGCAMARELPTRATQNLDPLPDPVRMADPYLDIDNPAIDGPYPATELPARYHEWPADLDVPIPPPA